MEFSYTKSTDTGTNMVTKDYSKSRMRENCKYGSVRGGQSNLIPSTRLRGFWWAPFKKKGRHYDKTIQPPCGRGEQANRACGAMEMHPDPRLRRYFPRRGKFALCLSLLSYPVNTIPVISHLRWLFPLWWLRHHLLTRRSWWEGGY